MKTVLIVAWYFPPDGGAGTQRAAKLCRYLPGFGWRPVVMTRSVSHAQTHWMPADDGLLADVGLHTVVVRAAELDSLEDAWVERALNRAAQLVERYDVDAILVTMSPFELSVLGRRLQQNTSAPVIYDLRDPWALDGVPYYGSRRRWHRQFALMRDTLAGADGVVANTCESRIALLGAEPRLRPERIEVIPNGFDKADFPPAPSPETRSHVFRLVHTGNFLSDRLYVYRSPAGWLRRWRHFSPEPIQPSGRTPLHLLRAVRILRDRGHPLGTALRLIHIGNDDAATRRCVRESRLQESVEFRGYLPHACSVRALQDADALFLHLHGLPPGRRSLIVPGKTYEYIAAKRPILGCLPDGDARDYVERTGRGYCADPCDARAIAEVLVRLYEETRAGTWQRDVDQSWIADLERRALSGRMAAFLDRLTPTGPAFCGSPAAMGAA